MRASQRIMHVDDNEADLEFFQEVFFSAGGKAVFTSLRDGEEALVALRALLPAKAGTLPDVVLLDINMPRVNGYEVLAYIKSQPELMGIPVIMLSGSDSLHDRTKAIKLGAVDYFIKPNSYMEAREFMQRVDAMIEASRS